jgi:uncharacterized membrane protein
MEDIFDLSVSKKEKEFVRLGLNLELEVTADIVETLRDIPYLGSLIKLGRIGKKFQELHFIRKLAKFLEKDQDVPNEKKEKFLLSLHLNQRKRLFEYLTHYLLRAEDDAKADVMGYIYRERILGQIDNDLFLRLCSIVDRSFVSDLKELPEYVVENKDKKDDDYIVANALINLGLIDNISMDMWGDHTILELNDIGQTLHRILSKNGWFDK